MDIATDRIAALETMLQSRTDSEGKSLKGYGENVRHLKAEIARLKAGGLNSAAVTAFPSPLGTPIDLTKESGVLEQLAHSAGVVYRRHPAP